MKQSAKYTPRKNKSVIKEKNYTIKTIEFSDGTSSMHRICDGYGPYELLGLLEFTKLEIMAQINGSIKPDFVKREVVK